MSNADETENANVVELDAAVRQGTTRRDGAEGASAVTTEAVRRLESLGEQHGRRELPPAYRGSIGRTLFDTPGSVDGELTVVMHANEIEKVTSQALLRIVSYPDDRRYVATVTAGPFYDPDGIRADSTPLVISAVNGAIGMPGHHGRVEASILGAETDGRIGPANRRPMPNSPVFTVRDGEMANILGLEGDFPLGVVMDHQAVEVPVPVHKKSVLYRHTAVLGTTGGGKSTTITNYVGGLSRHGAAVILLDTEGEYTTIHEVTDNADMLAMLPGRKIKAEGMANTHVYTLVGREPSNPDHPNSSEFSLDFTVLSPWTVIEILDLNEAQQSRFLTAYELARKLLQEVGVYPESKNREQEQEALEYDELERGYPKLELALLLDVVSHCIAKVSGHPPWRPASSVLQRRGATEKLQQMVEQAHLETNKYSWMKVSGLLWRLQRLKIFDRADAPKLNTKTMLQAGRVNIIDLSGLDSPILRNLAIAQILRETQAVQDAAYSAAGALGQTPTPVNIVIEEAHEFLSTSRIRQMPTLYEQVAKIAKRGRKRWLGLTFVTQLPQNMPDEVLVLLSQNDAGSLVEESSTYRDSQRHLEAEMDLQEAGDSGSRLATYVEGLASVIGHGARVQPLRDYCLGLLMSCERKSVEPMAAITAPARVSAQHQSLLHFIGKGGWSDETVLARVRDLVLPEMERHGPIDAWIIDDTGFPKQGLHSVGVARQYCGQLGKQDNCQVAVSLSIANHHASLPVAYRLYLPKDWAADDVRRRKAGVPKEIVFKTKPEIALDQLRWACQAGLPRGVVLLDAGYGNNSELRMAITALELTYVAGILSSTTAWAPGTGPLPPKPWSGRGRQPTRMRRDAKHQPITAKKLAFGLPKHAWRTIKWREGSAGRLSSRFARVRVRVAHRDDQLAECRAEEWLLIEWPEGEKEPTKYWLSTLPAKISFRDLVNTAKLRWRIERDYQDLKQEVGLGHFEGRGWRGFHHHATLCIAAYGFLISERETIPPSGPRSAGLLPQPCISDRYRPRGSAIAA